MHAIRMLEDADGSPNGHTVHTYRAGEVYSADSTPPVDAHLMTSFTVSGRAIECDAKGNPVGKPVDRRAYKAAHAPKPAEPEPEPDASDTEEDTGYNSPQAQARRRSR